MIANWKNLPIFAAQIGAWCSWLAFLHGVQAVASSSPAAPTRKQQRNLLLFLFYVVTLICLDNTKKDTQSDVLFLMSDSHYINIPKGFVRSRTFRS